MGNCSSANSQLKEKLISDEIDQEISKHAKKLKSEAKILLLGSSDGGKTTIVKQMKIIHQNGYSTEELERFKNTIYNNVVESAKNLIKGLEKTGLHPVNMVRVLC